MHSTNKAFERYFQIELEDVRNLYAMGTVWGHFKELFADYPGIEAMSSEHPTPSPVRQENYMANWKYKLDFLLWWNSDKFVTEKGALAAKEIKRVFPASWFDFGSDDYDQELDLIVENFGSVGTIKDFDEAMEMLYDWGDQEVAPFSQWPKNKMCWIATSF